jgi:hypothetical protein
MLIGRAGSVAISSWRRKLSGSLQCPHCGHGSFFDNIAGRPPKREAAVTPVFFPIIGKKVGLASALIGGSDRIDFSFIVTSFVGTITKSSTLGNINLHFIYTINSATYRTTSFDKEIKGESQDFLWFPMKKFLFSNHKTNKKAGFLPFLYSACSNYKLRTR